MKKFYLLTTTLCTLLICCLCNQSYAALSGTYTINASLAPSTSNYQSFQSAVSDLLNGTRTDGGTSNGIGVSGPVLFNVAAGTYTGQIDIVNSIPGASAINSVTFDGIDASTRIIEHNSITTTSRHTIRLAGTSYVTFRNLTIRTLGTYGWAVYLNAANTNSIRIKKCVINMMGSAVGAASPTHIGILMNSNTSSLGGTGYYSDSIEIDSNTILNGYCGIVLFGGQTTPTFQLNNKIRNNTVSNSFNTSIYARFQDGIHIENNAILPYRTLNSNGSGISIDNIISGPSTRLRISGNSIQRFGGYGLNMASVVGSSSLKGLVFNNMITDGYGSGIRMEACEDLDICNNTLNVKNGSAGFDAACYIDGGFSLMLYNNIFSVNQVSPILPLYANDPSAFDSIDYNILYRYDVSDGKFIFIGADISHKTFAGTFGFNDHSLFKKPAFVNDSNARVSNVCYKGLPISYVLTDIDKTVRNNPPTIGAHEGTPLRNNLFANAIEGPAIPFTTGLHDLTVSVQNLGDSIVGSFTISYIHNGNTPVTQTWLGTLNPCDTAWVVFTGVNQVNMVASNVFSIFTSTPNGGSDPDKQNDTLEAALHAPLNGHYIIGSGIAAHFNSFSTAVQALKSAGVSGPVVFDVDPGTYYERVSIDDNIQGSSSINTITFEGFDAATRIIDNDDANEDTYHTFQIASNYVRLRNLTIRASNTDFGWGVYISKRNGKNIHIKNCIIDIVNAQASQTFMGIGISGAPSFYYEDAFRVDSIEIDSNIIYNGFAGIMHKNYMFGSEPASTRLYFRNNTLYNNTQYGIFSEKANGTIIHGNKIVMHKTPLENATGISVSFADAPNASYRLVVTSNTIRNVNNSGIDIFTGNNTSVNRGLIANNSIISSGYNGIYMDNGTQFDIVNNSIKLDAFTSFPLAGAVNLSACASIKFVNNHLIVTAPGTTAAALVSDDILAFSTCNYNNIYTVNPTNAVYLDTWYSLDSYMGVGGLNVNNVTSDPHFINDSTLIPQNSCIKGISFAGVLTDINDSIRNSPPDIGAYEVSKFDLDLAVVKLITPTFPIDSGNQDIEVLIANHGTTPVSGGTIGYRLNGGTPVLVPLSATLNPCDTFRITFSGANQIHITNGVPYSLKLFTANPNGLPDLNTVNDTLIVELQTPMVGVYTIGATGADYSSINNAKIALSKRGISGNVLFKIKTGTYAEQVTFDQVTGASATSTITFVSEANHSDSVFIQYTPTVLSANYVIRMLGASYYTFKHLKITSTKGRAIELLTTSSYITIDSCRISCAAVTSSTGFNLGAGVYTPQGYSGSHLNITHNTITGALFGVYISGVSTTVLSDSNTVSDNTVSGAYLAALYLYNTSNLKVLHNTLSSTSTNANPYGINCSAGNNTLEINANKITMTTGGYGISLVNSVGTPTARALVANNVISISGTKASYGIRNQASNQVRIYHNSVLVNCTVSSFAAYLHYNGTAYRFNEVKNNVFANVGTGVAVYLHLPAPVLNNVESNYNNIYATGPNVCQSGSPNTSYANLHTWRIATLSRIEMQSVSYRPGFTNNTNLIPNISDSASWSLNGRGIHLDSTVLRSDVNGISRPLTQTIGVPDIGAYEFTPTALPPAAVAVPAIPVAGATQVFLFATDTVAKIAWDASSVTMPTAVKIRFYSGELHPGIDPVEYHTKAYWSMVADAGSYSYDMNLYYNEPMVGNLPSEANMKATQRIGSTPWNLLGSSSVNGTTNILSIPSLTDNSMFITGTDMNTPLPVVFNSITAKLQSSNVVLNWSTSSENQVSGFHIERLSATGKWEKTGFVKGSGNSNTIVQYSFTDVNPFSLSANKEVLYYRLQQVDYNKEFSYSPVVSVSRKEIPATDLIVYPNPFHTNYMLSCNALADETVSFEMYNVQGKQCINQTMSVLKGNNLIEINNIDNLDLGVYFIKITSNGEQRVLKVMKQ